MLTWLIDTGPLVAFFDSNDAAHAAVTESLMDFNGRLCTTSMVIGEVMHFLPEVAHGPERLLEFIAVSGLEIFESTRKEQLAAAVALMKRYRDTPMDFADATLVLLARDLGSLDVVTLDRRGFHTYRTTAGKSFRLVLG